MLSTDNSRYNRGLWGNSLSFVGFSWNFVSGHIRNVDTHLEIFSSKKQVIKKIIAKKPLTNLYEMNSTLWPTVVKSKGYAEKVKICSKYHIQNTNLPKQHHDKKTVDVKVVQNTKIDTQSYITDNS